MGQDVLNGEEQQLNPSADLSMDTSGEAEPTTRQPDWWHRDHPTFTPLAGFFSGMAYVVLVPGLFAAVLESTFSQETVKQLFPFVLVALVVPLALVVRPQTRRYGRYFLLGMVATAAVVLGVAAVVLWVLMSRQS